MTWRWIIGTAAALLAATAGAAPDPAGGETRPLVGFTVAETAPGEATITYAGPIDFPMAENLADIWARIRGGSTSVLLDLDSVGGELTHAEKVISVLADIREDARLRTRVRQGNRCLSACVLVFVQGERRLAGGATAWMFHGPCPLYTNSPAAEPTQRYVTLLAERGVSAGFLCLMTRNSYLESPGKFWASGYELVHVYDAGIITDLSEPWEPEAPSPPPFDPQLRGR